MSSPIQKRCRPYRKVLRRRASTFVKPFPSYNAYGHTAASPPAPRNIAHEVFQSSGGVRCLSSFSSKAKSINFRATSRPRIFNARLAALRVHLNPRRAALLRMPPLLSGFTLEASTLAAPKLTPVDHDPLAKTSIPAGTRPLQPSNRLDALPRSAISPLPIPQNAPKNGMSEDLVPHPGQPYSLSKPRRRSRHHWRARADQMKEIDNDRFDKLYLTYRAAA
jgi:hypothetical protein